MSKPGRKIKGHTRHCGNKQRFDTIEKEGIHSLYARFTLQSRTGAAEVNRCGMIEDAIVDEATGRVILLGIPPIFDFLADDHDAQHNCDAMGCASVGPHVLARIKYRKLVPMTEFASSAANQGGKP